MSSHFGAHPRTGGEHAVTNGKIPSGWGSPPHGRGTPVEVGVVTAAAGLTPARAGNTAGRCARSWRTWAHPRTGGEHAMPIRVSIPQSGSPPHGRGTLVHHLGIGQVGRLTPARAGNTSPRGGATWPTTAHPRTGGEHSGLPQHGGLKTGSPPHGRGTLRRVGLLHARQRLTPARAGNTICTTPASGAWPAHPRTGGEHKIDVWPGIGPGGSPPHGRGTRHQGVERRGLPRLTPARAGNTADSLWRSPRGWAHPRTGGEHRIASPSSASRNGSPPHGRGTRHGGCDKWQTVLAHPRTGGEHQLLAHRSVGAAGSPPHGRGTPKPWPQRRASGGLTPARAGNTTWPTRSAGGSPAHPRTGGEHDGAWDYDRIITGSPPHGRGTLPLDGARAGRPGLTPARAGNTWRSTGCGPSPTAHPRTGGEHGLVNRRERTIPGSPPHGRGTHLRCGCRNRLGGLTPARAGNTSTTCWTAWTRAAHPRTGGEHLPVVTAALSLTGSPPHGRGTQQSGDPHCGDPGLTPARAGNTSRRRQCRG